MWQLIQHHDEIILEFEDDGIGFDFDSTKTGIGLKSIFLRAETLNAEIKIETKEQGGFLFLLKMKNIK